MKKVLKIAGFALLGVVGAIMVAVVIFAIQGGFNPNKKQVNSLTVLVNDEPTKELMVDSDFIVQLNYTPGDAKALDVSVRVNQYGDNVIASVNGKAVGSGDITVTAGEPFRVRLAKDAVGNNNGGEADFIFESDNKFVRTSLKVMVDVELKDKTVVDEEEVDGLSIVSNSQGVDYDTTYEKFNMTVSPKVVNSLKLSSNISRALNPSTGLTPDYTGELKNIANKKAYVLVDDTASIYKGLITQTQDKCYNIDIKALSASANANVTVYVHRLYKIQKDFNDNWFEAIMHLGLGQQFTSVNAYNEFVNKHLVYFTRTLEAREFFEEYKQDVEKTVDGQSKIVREVVFEADDIFGLKNSLHYVLANVNANFVVEDVQIDDITVNTVDINVLEEDVITPTTIATKWGVIINPEVDNQSNREVLYDRLNEMTVGVYVVYTGDEEDIDPEATVGANDDRLMYIQIDDTWYVYSDKYATIAKAGLDSSTTWTLDALFPNYERTDFIDNTGYADRQFWMERTYVFYSIPNLKYNKATDEVIRTIKYAVGSLRVMYHPNIINFNFQNNLYPTTSNRQKVIMVNEDSKIVTTTESNTGINTSLAVNSNSVLAASMINGSSNTDNSEYTKVMWYLIYSTNYITYPTSGAIQMFDAGYFEDDNGEYVFDELTKTYRLANPSDTGLTKYSLAPNYLSMLDGAPFKYTDDGYSYETDSHDRYTKLLYLGDSEQVALRALNSSTISAYLSSARGAKLLAVRVATDMNGDPLVYHVGIDGIDNYPTYVVSKWTTDTITFVSTYMFTSADELYYYYNPVEDTGSAYVVNTSEFDLYEAFRYEPDAEGSYVWDDDINDYRSAGPGDDGKQRYKRYDNVVDFVKGNSDTSVYISPFKLTSGGDIDETEYTVDAMLEVSKLHNLKIGLINYNKKIYNAKDKYIDKDNILGSVLAGVAVENFGTLSPENIAECDASTWASSYEVAKSAITWTAQETCNTKDLIVQIMTNDLALEKITEKNASGKESFHDPIVMKVKVIEYNS